ncbi:hypothetical protein KY333_00930 [Candidatus Woesearchaeota archaeon]|nr:hypothetical protein [Candidatus Woesearchaeota archaeon]MBW2994035.1 hypothetical protein [Candidatus Woesearchaeota archaeon]
MTIAGIQFDKIVVDRTDTPKGKMSVKNNILIQDLEKKDFSVGQAKQFMLLYKFEFTAEYEPKIAKIVLNGTVTSIEKEDKIDELVKAWKKDKKLPKEIMTPLLNNILSKSNVEALILAREVGLPPPIQLPRVTVK